MELRDYQRETIKKTYAAIKDGKSSIAVCLPTGAGKTRIAAEIIRHARSRGKTVLFVVHLKTLVNQAAKAFTDLGLNVGIIQAENTSYEDGLDDVIVASVHTLAKRKKPESHTIVIIDECHILYKEHKEMIKRWREIEKMELKTVKKLVFMGLSATPMREDLGLYFDELVHGPTVKELVDMGYLVPAIGYYPNEEKVQEIRSKLKTRNSVNGGKDFVESDLVKGFQTANVVGDIVSHWKQYGENRRTILFAITKANSIHISDCFAEEGISSAYIDDQTKAEERRKLFDDLKEGKIRVLCSVGVLSIGFDAPWVECIILARMTKSPSLHMQQIGRGLRTWEGKKDCIILDHTGNLCEHGMPEDFFVEFLGDQERNAQKRKGKQKRKLGPCKQCGFMQEIYSKTCPQCGVDRPIKMTSVNVIEGNLNKGGKKTAILRDSKSEYLQLLYYAREKGYKDGWAYMKFMERYDGRKPDWNWKYLEPRQTGMELIRWIRSRNIRYAKARDKERKNVHQAGST